ncbi:MAG: dihydroxy-acid dehydratase, partial [Kangiellaceae bacterium]|nr:dihydroxy-acid dehydratase [Kangiellaceae bacterium]
DINHFHAAGGMGYLMLQLAQSGYLHQNVNTILGKGLEYYFEEPVLENNRFSVIMKTGSGTGVSEQMPATFEEKQLTWKGISDRSLDDSVLRPASEPFSKTGGLKLLTGNLGRAVIKVSAVKEEHQIIEAPAVVFDSQNEFQQSFDKGELEKDLVAVIRFQGPRMNGMPELHKLTPLLGVLQDKGFKVAIVTDGRMSGASGKVPAAIHLVPEASDGGLIAKVKNGDLIRVDAKQGTVELLIATTELDKREAKTLALKENTFGTGREIFKVFRQSVTGAEQGASIL